MSATELKEVLDAQSGLLFYEEALSPVFCKPKLIPLKSVTLEKLDKMQRESMETIKQLEKNIQETSLTSNKTEDTTVNKEKKADIWTVEENQEVTTT